MDILTRMTHFLISIIKNISSEPAVVLNSLAGSIHTTANQVGLYHVMCDKILAENGMLSLKNETIDCWGPDFGKIPNPNSTAWNDLEIQMQASAASWNMIFSIAYTIPSIFADIFLGAYSDHRGRKYPILWGLFGCFISKLPWVFLFYWPTSAPMYTIVIGYALGGFTGFFAVISISAAAYIADTVADSRTLTIRMTVLSLSSGIANIIGPLLAKPLLSLDQYSWAVILALAIEILAIGAAVFLLKQMPPKDLRNITELKAKGVTNEQIQLECSKDEKSGVLDESCTSAMKQAFLTVIDLSKSVWHTFTKRRPNHGRAYLLILTVAIFFSATAENITTGMIMTLFVQKSPFFWNQNLISDYKSISYAVCLIGSILGIFLFKKRWQLSDTLLIIISLVSTILRCLLMALATQDWCLYVAAALGFLSPLVLPCVQSFIAKTVEVDEVGKSYTAFSLATNLAMFANNLIFTGIYQATVAYFAGFTFLLCGIFLGIILCAAVWIHIDYNGYSLRCWKQKVTSC